MVPVAIEAQALGPGAGVDGETDDRQNDHAQYRHRSTGGGLRRHRREKRLADPGQGGGQRLVLRFKGVALLRRDEHERGPVFDAKFVERLGDIEPGSVRPVQLVGDIGINASTPRRFQIIGEQFDNAVDEDLDRYRGRVDLRDQVFTADDRHRATGRKGYLRHHRGLSASGTYLSARAAAISKSRNRDFLLHLVAGIDDAALGQVRVVGHELDRGPGLTELLGEIGRGVLIVLIAAVIENHHAARYQLVVAH